MEREGKLFVLKLLKRRFGDLPPWMVERIEGLRLEQIDQLGDVLLDFETLANVETWFKNIGKTSESADTSPCE